ncbi:proteasome endopeptidase complex, archaeal, alpha subunit [Nanoarchaeota archaeon]|nr:MAG: proteasome endopeptidase complex, archaeal, alpha subunit [Nanoarchaeota archaeon]
MNMRDMAMGYDRASTVFSPDGRLLQVEYARKTVNQGATAVGVRCKDGVVLLADKRIVDKLVVPHSVEKVYKIDDHIGATLAGLVSDGRVLVDKARLTAQRNNLTYGEPVDVITIVKDIADYCQAYTQYGGIRPFGVSLIVGGVNEVPKLYVVELSGVYFEYKATAIGEGARVVNKYLESKYKENITVKEGVKLALNALKSFLGPKFELSRIEAAVIHKDPKRFVKLTEQELSRY